MMKDTIEVEVKLVTARKKKRDEAEWRREERERKVDKELEHPSTLSSKEAIIDTMLRTMEIMMERLLVDDRPPPRENQEQRNRNLNSRRPQISQNKKRNFPYPPVRPPFQDNFMEQDGENQTKDEIHQLEHDNAFLKRGETLRGKTNDFRRGYQFVVLDV